MPLPEDRNHTIDDIYKLPEGQRAELIDGQLYMMAPPSTRHQRISGWLYVSIYHHIKIHGGDCEVFAAPFAVYLTKNEKVYVEPDISVICNKDKINERGCNGAPDFIIEIVSSGNAGHDYLTKLNLYKVAGVREYWIVNPATETITIYCFENEIWAEPHTFSEKIKVNICDNLFLDFSELTR